MTNILASHKILRDFCATYFSREIPESLKRGFDQKWLGLTCLQIIQAIPKNYEKIQRGQRSSQELRKNIYKVWAQDFSLGGFWLELNWGFDFAFHNSFARITEMVQGP